ncbi:MAG: hypothetical protein EGR36_03175 [Eubacterium ventriosum]|uniref:right-handed parallel beta-helix repeat-containing protein n=1 Tax=Eubacterium ventriosum TaxID=39496 RepID=UPI001D209BEF|nr:hypothetical protein [Eubacterium ventriosum]MBD9054991.1 hypothetical protein [Eubacterium ventriosum]
MKLKNKIIKTAVMVVAVCGITFAFQTNTYAKKNFKVTPSKVEKQSKKSFRTITTKYTKHYLGLNAFLDKMEKAGGGTLTIKKGTYYISNAIYVPSNTTVVFENGVVFKKINKTGTNYKASGSMWQICPRSKSKKKNSIRKYKGAKNVTFKAKGKVTFDMNNITGITIVAAHNQNIDISGITFKNQNGNHYVEVNGSKDVNIHDCYFGKSKKSTREKNYMKEAINIDLADKATHGLPLDWVKKDKTPCYNVTVENNVFDSTTRGVGTHKYSQNSKGENIYHQNITIRNNEFKNIHDNGVFVLNWKNTKIENNKFTNIGNLSKKSYSSGAHAISGGGIEEINITGNTFTKIKRNPVYFCIQQNVGGGSNYKKVGMKITKEETKAMLDNKVSDCGYDMNSIFHGYDILYFKGSGERSRSNAVGVNINKQIISYGL